LEDIKTWLSKKTPESRRNETFFSFKYLGKLEGLIPPPMSTANPELQVRGEMGISG
jgi:hypothetical protein